MENTIKLRFKQSYGNSYLVCEQAAGVHISRLTGRKTITQGDIVALEALGLKISYTEEAQAYLSGKY